MRRLAGDAGPRDPPADDEQVESAGRQIPDSGARGRIHLLNIDSSVPVLGFEQRPSFWFTANAGLIRPGARVLDVACGVGRHALAAAALGATVVAVDRDPVRLKEAEADAARRQLTSIEWREADLEKPWPDLGQFDVVLLFNYLDRPRMPRILEAVAPGGHLLFETFLEIQRQLGWGPERDAHLLKYGEVAGLVAPLTPLHGREAFEPADNAQWAAVASIVAKRAK
ncbi:MAG: class I SAM-dependent methyltransferase [Gemmatimonadales bacterium]